ncbi:hypothetical protein ZIOFF_055149 [Zingiber officinale]|uniref:PNPLA domain-containing protein n=1 Tax=Zingiber officinale TaxID=94328 RepID=A0A8J5KEB9_ZINOF|nr:hypothetical protein ZIOFF_055149 [Zingiber officinale]
MGSVTSCLRIDQNSAVLCPVTRPIRDAMQCKSQSSNSDHSPFGFLIVFKEGELYLIDLRSLSFSLGPVEQSESTWRNLLGVSPVHPTPACDPFNLPLIANSTVLVASRVGVRVLLRTDYLRGLGRAAFRQVLRPSLLASRLLERMAFIADDKLSCEIFSILESKFLFPLCSSAVASPWTPVGPRSAAAGRVRILSIDGGGNASDGFLAAAALTRMESTLRRRTGDASASVADFFDLAAGSGAGGVLVAMLFTRGHDGRPLFSAAEALQLLLAESRRRSGGGFGSKRKGIFRGLFGRSGGLLRKIFGDASLRDTLKPVLIPCHDLATGSPFVFSRADAVEADAYDFFIRDVCAATCEDAVELRSVDGRTRVSAVGGGVAVANPAAAAITHVLHNKQEFPFAVGVEDLMVVSIGASGGASATGKAQIVRVAVEGAADMVDQAVSMAFGEIRTSNYVRIQANGFISGNSTPRAANSSKLMEEIDEILSQRNVDSLLFRGKKISEKTKAEKLEWFAGELVKEENWRRKSSIPTVLEIPVVP